MSGSERSIDPILPTGLDLTDPDDRAIYRGMVAEAFKHCRVTGIVRYAQQAGSGYARPNPKRADAVRALADAWIEEFTR